MPAPSSNLFLRLHKWAHRQDENFLTESLAVVLEQLLVLAPAVATRLISHFTGGFINLSPEDAGTIAVHTQVEAVSGRPDLEIGIPHKLAWIEVKAESELRKGQLEGYRVLLKQAEVAQTQLVLLTQYPEVIAPDDERPDKAVRWFENELPAVEQAGEIAGFLVRQFLGFLEARNMTLTQVGKLLPEGLRALPNLTNMLYEAARACKVSAQKRANWEDIWLNLDGLKYAVGVTFSEPEKLWFETYSHINIDAAAKLGAGEVYENKQADGGYSWGWGIELDSEVVHFYSRSKVGQMEWLEEFLRDCLTKARSIEMPNQPPRAEKLDDESE